MVDILVYSVKVSVIVKVCVAVEENFDDAARGPDMAAEREDEAPGKLKDEVDVAWTSCVSLGCEYCAYIGARTRWGCCVVVIAEIIAAYPLFTVEDDSRVHACMLEFHDKVGVHVT